jgi:hypothetical protein
MNGVGTTLDQFLTEQNVKRSKRLTHKKCDWQGLAYGFHRANS